MQETWTALRRWAVGDGLPEVAVTVLAAVTLYLVALLVTRTGKKRFLGRNTVFDVILAFMLGSVMARAINGDASLVETTLAGFVLVGMHWIMGTIAARTSIGFGSYVKGEPDQVVEDGVVDWDAMRHHHLTRHDLEEAARQSGLAGADEVQQAHFERDGRISIVPKRRLHVLEVRVEDGVQTVRVEVET